MYFADELSAQSTGPAAGGAQRVSVLNTGLPPTNVRDAPALRPGIAPVRFRALGSKTAFHSRLGFPEPSSMVPGGRPGNSGGKPDNSGGSSTPRAPQRFMTYGGAGRGVPDDNRKTGGVTGEEFLRLKREQAAREAEIQRERDRINRAAEEESRRMRERVAREAEERRRREAQVRPAMPTGQVVCPPGWIQMGRSGCKREGDMRHHDIIQEEQARERAGDFVIDDVEREGVILDEEALVANDVLDGNGMSLTTIALIGGGLVLALSLLKGR